MCMCVRLLDCQDMLSFGSILSRCSIFRHGELHAHMVVDRVEFVCACACVCFCENVGVCVCVCLLDCQNMLSSAASCQDVPSFGRGIRMHTW